MKVLITGASGLLGTALIDHLADNFELTAVSRSHGFIKGSTSWSLTDILDLTATRELLLRLQPNVVIHCAALVNVDACEKDSQLAERLHRGTTEIISHSLSEWNGRLVYISTDSVFDGKKKGLYTEQDLPNPSNIYAKTKLQGELVALAYNNSIVLRTNIFGWSRAKRLSFSEWVLKGLIENTTLTMYTDVHYTPIHVYHLADIINNVLHRPDLKGVYHATGNQVLSKYDFAIMMASIFGLNTDNVIPASIDTVDLIANRPKNMALSNSRLSSALNCKIPGGDKGITLMKQQYDRGWVAQIKGYPTMQGYRFWETE